MPDRSKGISPQMVSAGQQARDYNANINDYLRDVGRILNKSYIEGDTRPENEIIRDIVGDYDNGQFDDYYEICDREYDEEIY